MKRTEVNYKNLMAPKGMRWCVKGSHYADKGIRWNGNTCATCISKMDRDYVAGMSPEQKARRRESQKRWQSNNSAYNAAKSRRHYNTKIQSSCDCNFDCIKVEIDSWIDKECSYCGSTKDLQVDHIVPISKGGLHCGQNIQQLCKTCNIRKSDKVESELDWVTVQRN